MILASRIHDFMTTSYDPMIHDLTIEAQSDSES